MQTTEIPLISWLRANNIRKVFTDLDDTLIKTGPLFGVYIDQVYRMYLEAVPELAPQLLQDTFSRINIELRKTYAVNPMVWEKVIMGLHHELKLPSELAMPAIELLAKIYVTVPELEEGALDLLTELDDNDIPAIVVTHANVNWTGFKLSSTPIGQLTKDVVIHNENDPHKDKSVWVRARRRNRVSGEQALAMGDNIQGDMVSSYQAGYQHRVWFDQKNGWSPTRVGELPPGTLTIKSLRQLLRGQFFQG